MRRCMIWLRHTTCRTIFNSGLLHYDDVVYHVGYMLLVVQTPVSCTRRHWVRLAVDNKRHHFSECAHVHVRNMKLSARMRTGEVSGANCCRIKWFYRHGVLRRSVSRACATVADGLRDDGWYSKDLPASLRVRVLAWRKVCLHSAVAVDQQRWRVSTGELHCAESTAGGRKHAADMDWWTGQGRCDAAEQRQHSDGCRTTPPRHRRQRRLVKFSECRSGRYQGRCRPAQPDSRRADVAVSRPLRRRRRDGVAGTTASEQVPTVCSPRSHRQQHQWRSDHSFQREPVSVDVRR